ncbi:TPA: hypothetical protein IBW21_005073, partial [Escherichia coli]|nr:hypothetical protein [Escherichia coli]
MSKKFTKTVLSTALAGVLFGVSFGAVAETITKKISDNYYISVNTDNDHALIKKYSDDSVVIGPFSSKTGMLTTVNIKEVLEKLGPKVFQPGVNTQAEFNKLASTLSMSVYVPELSPESIDNISEKDIVNVNSLVKKISGSTTEEGMLTSKNVSVYNNIVKNNGDADIALNIIKNGNAAETQAQIYADTSNKISNLSKYTERETSFALDRNGNITLDENESVGNARESVKNVVAAIQADTTIYQEEDGSYTHDVTAPKNVRVSDAIVDLDKSIKDRTTVGVNSDGTFTRAEAAKNTISVNDGLVALSGRTDRIDAAVGAIDGRVTRNTQSIEKNSKAIAANTRTLQQHSARLDSQQRQINENHKEMKRAAAQSAALTGLFQPYSVGKFNATAAVGGYSDQQALAVGVGYRFNEQTAAKAGV